MQFLRDILISFFGIVHNFVKLLIDNPNYSYGIAIILFTVVIRLILLPLNIKQTKSQAKLQEVQPKMQEIQNKYKNDPQKSQQEVMKLYKEAGTSPLGGCLPLLIQMPVLFAMYSILRGLGTEISGVHFLWLKDLNAPDKLFILPVLSVVTQYISSKIIMPAGNNPQAKSMSSMNTFMAIFIGFMAINLQSSLVLYWVTNNVIAILQTLFMRKMGYIGSPKNNVSADTKGTEGNKQAIKEVSTDSANLKSKKGSSLASKNSSGNKNSSKKNKKK